MDDRRRSGRDRTATTAPAWNGILPADEDEHERRDEHEEVATAA